MVDREMGWYMQLMFIHSIPEILILHFYLQMNSYINSTSSGDILCMTFIMQCVYSIVSVTYRGVFTATVYQ